MLHPEEPNGARELVYGPYLGSLHHAAGPKVGPEERVLGALLMNQDYIALPVVRGNCTGATNVTSRYLYSKSMVPAELAPPQPLSPTCSTSPTHCGSPRSRPVGCSSSTTGRAGRPVPEQTSPTRRSSRRTIRGSRSVSGGVYPTLKSRRRAGEQGRGHQALDTVCAQRDQVGSQFVSHSAVHR